MLDTRRCQFYRQRQPIQARANLRDSLRIVIVSGKPV